MEARRLVLRRGVVPMTGLFTLVLVLGEGVDDEMMRLRWGEGRGMAGVAVNSAPPMKQVRLNSRLPNLHNIEDTLRADMNWINAIYVQYTCTIIQHTRPCTVHNGNPIKVLYY